MLPIIQHSRTDNPPPLPLRPWIHPCIDYLYSCGMFVLKCETCVVVKSNLSVCLQQDCPNGRLTPAKFVDMYKMFFPSGNAEEFCDHVFRTFDMDKNGYIDFKVNLSYIVSVLANK